MAKFTLRDLWDAFPDNDLLAFRPPKPGEDPITYALRATLDCADPLYAFLVRELFGRDICNDPHAQLKQLNRVIDDVGAVRARLEQLMEDKDAEDSSSP